MNKRQREAFELFREENGEPTYSERVPEAALWKYQSVLPATLLEFWKVDGWAGYKNGLWWLTDPGPLNAVVGAWLAETPFAKIDKYHAIARSGFGAIYAWGEKLGQHVLIDCPNHFIVALRDEFDVREDDPDLAMGTLLASLDRVASDIEDDDGNSLFDQCIENLGPLNKNELFGFEPALVLGGKADVAHIAKLRMDVHLHLLRQFGAPKTPGFEDLG